MYHDRPANYQEDAKKVCRHYRETNTCRNTTQRILFKSHTNFFPIFFSAFTPPFRFFFSTTPFPIPTYFCGALWLLTHTKNSQKT